MVPRFQKEIREHLAFRTELRALYDQVDSLLSGFTCDSTTECCRFGVTGREPYPTAIEIAELMNGIGARGGMPKRRLPQVDLERNCPLLSSDGRCTVYAARPFGCRTFFCERVQGEGRIPRKEIAELGRKVADLSQRFHPRDPGARPLTKVLTKV